jgi:hypothetical protein
MLYFIDEQVIKALFAQSILAQVAIIPFALGLLYLLNALRQD